MICHFFLTWIYYLFPTEEYTIQGCSISLLLSSSSEVLGLCSLSRSSSFFFLISSRAQNRAVTSFCLVTSWWNISSYTTLFLKRWKWCAVLMLYVPGKSLRSFFSTLPKVNAQKWNIPKCYNCNSLNINHRIYKCSANPLTLN